MTAIPDDLMATDREVELVCPECGERCLVHVHDGEEITDKQAECHCGGWGEEI